MTDASLFQAYMNSRGIKTPAFTYDVEKGFVPTEQTQKVVDLLKQASGKKFNLQPANSVMATEGSPIWGTGGGVVYNDSPGVRQTGYVDPLLSTTHTVAHEGSHAVFPSALKETTFKLNDAFASGLNPTSSLINPLSIPRDTGQRMRWVHETFGKPSLVEETHAQGVADAVLNKLGIPVEQSISQYKTSLDYPATYITKGIDTYAQNEIGPPSPYEKREAQRIFKASGPLMERVYQQGYNLIR